MLEVIVFLRGEIGVGISKLLIVKKVLFAEK